MILVDVSQIIKSAVAATMNMPDAPETVEPGLVRHIFLNSLRAIRMKHKAEFGEVVLCVDSFEGKLWRKEIFPYYKARRKTRYEESKIDWAAAYPVIQMVIEELRDEFPYKFVMVNTCEADDVIGTICHRLGTEGPFEGDNILIVSSDKDFIQLQKFWNVRQFNNISEQFLHTDNAEQYLFEKILGGDSGDDIPNVRSQDDFFMGENGRQKPITKKIKEDFEAYKATDPDAERRFNRNEKMIDLSRVPSDLQDLIMIEFNKSAHPLRRSKLLTYMSKHRLRDLVEKYNDF